MADRRMLTKRVTDDDHFLALSASAQALYLHLSMSSDDDGFCRQVAVCMFKAHASTSDLEALLKNRYVYQFENGVIVIKHWRMANALRKDRYTPTIFKEELAQLALDENGSYALMTERLPNGCQMVANCLPQDRLGKDRLGKDRIGEDNSSEKKAIPAPKKPKYPTLDEVREYANTMNLNVDPDAFYEYFNTPNVDGEIWVDSRGSKVKNWKQKMQTWNRMGSAPRKKAPEDRYDNLRRLMEEVKHE